MTAADDPIRSTDPLSSAGVLASAGTGKTWLLVTRMLRLMLTGTEAGELLAVTFTNKAAAEMQDRLVARARSWLDTEDAALDTELRAMDMAPDPELRARARGLFEHLLTTADPPRCSTFHAFCQDLLARFPLEAAVPPGFELVGNSRLLKDAAWDALLRDATRDRTGMTARALDELFVQAGKPDAVRALLNRFLAHRSDWSAWQHALAVDAQDITPALAAIDAHLRLGEAAEQVPGEDGMHDAALEWVELLTRKPTKTVAGLLLGVTSALESGASGIELAGYLDAVVNTKGGTPRAQLYLKGLDAPTAARIDGLSDSLRRVVNAIFERSRRESSSRLNAAWITAGLALSIHYDRLKSEQRLLDFDDLEWRACLLLNDTDNAHWIQYKLDRRIGHLLVDEFQDTNPTQWRLLRPLLNELAAGDPERPRTAFIVGDAKQSIYGFRRANPELLGEAVDWMRKRLSAETYNNPLSRRASPAIIEFVNAFCPTLTLPRFMPHGTVRGDLWGRVEWLQWTPPDQEAVVDSIGMRNPLHAPRTEPGASKLEIEAEAVAIAERIAEICDGTTVIEDDGAWRAAGPGDCIVLVRKRTHLAALERAFQAKGVPFDSETRGMLLERLEVRDIVALLELLVAPWQGLLLAQVLKSPLFGLDDTHLLALSRGARSGSDWFGHLSMLASESGADPALVRAHGLLTGWRLLVDRVPVHDLLDRIYDEGVVLQRYAAATPPHRAAITLANLERVLELALESDSGRYPTLPRFVERLNEARTAADEEYSDAVAGSTSGRVRIMTVHAAKGLEAPVVFVAQTGFSEKGDTWRVLVDWPTSRDAPNLVRIVRRSAPDAPAEALLAIDAERAAREEHNLLYVAITRAKQMLVLSGRGKGGWIDDLRGYFEARNFAPHVHGVPPQPSETTPRDSMVGPDVSGMTGRLPDLNPRVAVEQTTTSTNQAANRAEARLHGILVHRALELLCRGITTPEVVMADECGLAPGDTVLRRACEEAGRVHQMPVLDWLFSPGQAWNEVPVMGHGPAGAEHGIIDRLVVDEAGTVWVIDYKTHPDPGTRIDALVELHRPQLERYRALVQPLWPGSPVSAAVLFTAEGRLIEIGDARP